MGLDFDSAFCSFWNSLENVNEIYACLDKCMFGNVSAFTCSDVLVGGIKVHGSTMYDFVSL